MKTVICIAFLSTPILAIGQDGTGSIQGTISGPQGEKIPYLWVRAKSAGDQQEAGRSETSSSGAYRIDGLEEGEYLVEVSPPCCAYVSHESEAIAVAQSAATVLDIALEEGDSFNTVGDDPGNLAAAVRSETVIPDKPVPRLANGKPDLSGMWLISFDPFPEEPEVFEWAEKIFEERAANSGRDHPHTNCLPGDPPIAVSTPPFFAKFVHKDELLVQLLEDYPGFRQIFADGRSHPDYIDPSWLGHSIAQWDGDTLVVDTIGYNDRGWNWFWPRSEELRITERYTRPEFGQIQIEITYEDPKVFKKPWSERYTLYLAPQEELIEYVCENNKW